MSNFSVHLSVEKHWKCKDYGGSWWTQLQLLRIPSSIDFPQMRILQDQQELPRRALWVLSPSQSWAAWKLTNQCFTCRSVKESFQKTNPKRSSTPTLPSSSSLQHHRHVQRSSSQQHKNPRHLSSSSSSSPQFSHRTKRMPSSSSSCCCCSSSSSCSCSCSSPSSLRGQKECPVLSSKAGSWIELSSSFLAFFLRKNQQQAAKEKRNHHHHHHHKQTNQQTNKNNNNNNSFMKVPKLLVGGRWVGWYDSGEI